jgi:phosphohistidine phosphatase
VNLIIVRHGIAFPHGTPGMKEDERPLTKEGIKKMKEAARGLLSMACIPDLILSSPLPRAKQTADILVEILGKEIPLVLTDTLSPGGSREEFYKEMGKRGTTANLMIVGHQPSLGEMAGEIAWGSAEYYLNLKKGGACALEIESMSLKPRGSLLWLLTPAIMRNIG